MNPPNERLRQARIDAGYKTATSAIEKFNWKSITYRAHENGQNNYGLDEAKIYAKAYGVTATWLLLGCNELAENLSQGKTKLSGSSRADIVANIYEIAVQLNKDPNNKNLFNKLESCIKSYKKK